MLACAVALAGVAGADETPTPGAIADVVLQSGGVLDGRVASIERPSSEASRPRRVFLVRQGRVVSEALVDGQGRFRMQRLSGGLAFVAVDDPTRIDPRPCRLWPAETAPPGAMARVSLAPDVVRSQNVSFLTMGFPRAAALTGIATGAVAAPVIYHNIQQSHKPPAPISP